MTNKALIIVDVQNDFLEGGALGVEGGKATADRICTYLDSLEPYTYDLIVTTQDWHFDPGDHFEKWPVHCEAWEDGARLYEPLQNILYHVQPHMRCVYKGMFDDGYSGFRGITETLETLQYLLNRYGITDVYICGIATDYCVQATANDALQHNFNTTVLTDLIAGVSVEYSEQALNELQDKGATLTTSERTKNA